MRKLTILTAGGIGYVLGARAGRERYEQIKAMATRAKNDPRVQEKAHQATEMAKEKAPVVKDRLSHAADTARSKVSSGGSKPEDGLNPESTALQDDPYPKGDLP